MNNTTRPNGRLLQTINSILAVVCLINAFVMLLLVPRQLMELKAVLCLLGLGPIGTAIVSYVSGIISGKNNPQKKSGFLSSPVFLVIIITVLVFEALFAFLPRKYRLVLDIRNYQHFATEAPATIELTGAEQKILLHRSKNMPSDGERTRFTGNRELQPDSVPQQFILHGISGALPETLLVAGTGGLTLREWAFGIRKQVILRGDSVEVSLVCEEHEDARIVVTDTNGKILTARNGRVRMELPRFAVIRFACSKEGFDTARKIVELTADTLLHISLEHAEAAPLPPVTIHIGDIIADDAVVHRWDSLWINGTAFPYLGSSTLRYPLSKNRKILLAIRIKVRNRLNSAQAFTGIKEFRRSPGERIDISRFELDRKVAW